MRGRRGPGAVRLAHWSRSRQRRLAKTPREIIRKIRADTIAVMAEPVIKAANIKVNE